MNDKILKVNSNCSYESLDNEMIILNQDTGKYHELNNTGQIIFSMISNDNLSINDLIDKLSIKYSGKFDKIELSEFLEHLISRKILMYE